MMQIQMNKPQQHSLEHIHLGQKVEFSVTVTQEMVKTFLDLSGDHNPIHWDDAYAQQTQFKRVVVPGMLLGSFFSRLVGMYIPGEHSLYLGQELRFRHVAFTGDRIVVQGEVTAVSLVTGVISLKTTIYNQDNQLLVEGEAKTLYRKS